VALVTPTLAAMSLIVTATGVSPGGNG